MATICNLSYPERIKAIADMQNNIDHHRDKIRRTEGYTGPDLP